MREEILKLIPREEFVNEISEMFYNKNFGTKTKSDIELVMFKKYFSAAKQLATDEMGITDENKISDYKIGYDLGISPSRVRNLRLKMELQAENDFNWKEELERVLTNENNLTKYGDLIQITIRSRNLFYAIEDWVEESGQTLEITLNPKQLKVPKKVFYELMQEINTINEKQNDAALKQLIKKFKIADTTQNIIDGCLRAAEIGKSMVEIIESISGPKLLSKSAIKVVSNLINVFSTVKK